VTPTGPIQPAIYQAPAGGDCRTSDGAGGPLRPCPPDEPPALQPVPTATPGPGSLIDALNDTDPRVRAAAVLALGQVVQRPDLTAGRAIANPLASSLDLLGSAVGCLESAWSRVPAVLHQAVGASWGANAGSPRSEAALAEPASETRAWLTSVLVQLVSVLAALLIVLAALLVLFFWVLRRFSRANGPLIRLECVNTLPPGQGGYLVADLGRYLPVGGGHAAPGPPPAGRTEEELGQPFDLGPSYEEERQMKQQAARQQEEALLRQLAEENIRLQEQLTDDA
jgi:hypothetical protein